MIVLAACAGTDTQPSPPPEQTYDVPIAIITGIDSNIDDITADQARAVLDDARAPWAGSQTRVIASQVPEAGAAEVPHPAFAVELVARTPNVVAVVPVTAVTPRVRAVTIDGRSALRGNPDYPLTTERETKPGPRLVTTIVGDIMLARGVRDSME